MILFWLYVLATLDGAFCGNRSAAGRSGLINKRAYYFWAMTRGAFWAQVAAFLAATALFFLWKYSPGRAALLADLQATAHRMLLVFVPYTIVVLATFIVRALPSVDIRSATSVLIFGPMTALRPLVSIAGVLYGIIPAHRWDVRLLGVFLLTLMLGVEQLIDYLAEKQARTHFFLWAPATTENGPSSAAR